MQSTLTQGGGKTQSISSASAVTGAMTDACKRRKNVSSDSEWDERLDDLRIVRPLKTRPAT